MWLARPHLKQVWEDIWSGRREPGELSHRFTFLLMIFCILGVGVIGVGIGLPFVFVLFYVTIFLVFSIAVTRLRAALGAPTHEMAFMGPHQLVLDFHGAAGLQPDLVTRTMSTFHIMNRLHRTHPMPTLMEGLYLADRTGLSGRFDRSFTVDQRTRTRGHLPPGIGRRRGVQARRDQRLRPEEELLHQ